MSSLKAYGLQEEYAAEGSTINTAGAIDLNKKTVDVTANSQCSAQVNGEEVRMDTTLKTENAHPYIRFNNVTGQLTNKRDGGTIDIEKAYSIAKGQWYDYGGDLPIIKAQLENGIFVFSDGIIAPDHDSNKVADALINNKAITYDSIDKIGANHVIKATSDKKQYTAALKEAFPELKEAEAIVELTFGELNTIKSEITVDSNGNMISTKHNTINLCKNLFEQQFGTGIFNLDNEISGVSRQVPLADIKPEPVRTDKLLSQLLKELVY